MQQVLKNITDEDLRAYVVWLPVLQDDDLASAIARSKEYSDPRVKYYWDSGQRTGHLWKPVLDIPRQIAWDVYFLYDREAAWGAQPGAPDFWMHQLEGVSNAPRLDTAVFEQKAKELLEAAAVPQ